MTNYQHTSAAAGSIRLDNCAKAEQASHQEAISASLERLAAAIERIDRTNAAVNGHLHGLNKTEGTSVPKGYPALREFLDTLPGTIDTLADQLNETASQLGSALRV
jgi:ABC-type transporter Mla subunit MlaD